GSVRKVNILRRNRKRGHVLLAPCIKVSPPSEKPESCGSLLFFMGDFIFVLIIRVVLSQGLATCSRFLQYPRTYIQSSKFLQRFLPVLLTHVQACLLYAINELNTIVRNFCKFFRRIDAHPVSIQFMI